MRPEIVSGIVTEDALVSYWSIFSVVPSNSPRSLCKSQLDPVSLSFLKWQMMVLGSLNKTFLSDTRQPEVRPSHYIYALTLTNLYC